MTFDPCHTAIALFLSLALGGIRRFLCIGFGYRSCSKMAALCLTLHRLLLRNVYEEDRMMSPRVLKNSVYANLEQFVNCICDSDLQYVGFSAIIGAKSKLCMNRIVFVISSLAVR
jgi:hypothetical protein